MNTVIKVFRTLSFVLMGLLSTAVIAQNYCVDPQGSDDNGGSCTVLPTIAEVNALTSSDLFPNSTVLFKRGGVWRETLNVPASGSVNEPIIFGAYGATQDINGNPIPNPLIIKTESFNEWWLDSMVRNGGFELFTDNSPSTNFESFSEWNGILGEVACPAIADDTESNRGLYSVKMLCDQTTNPFGSGSFRANVNTAFPNQIGGTSYYLSSWSKSYSASNPLILRIKFSTSTTNYYYNGSDWETTHQYMQPWNAQSAGNWSEQVQQFTLPVGETGNLQVSFYQYSDQATWLDDVYLVKGTSPAAEKIWFGAMKNSQFYYGAISITGERLQAEEAPDNYEPQSATLGYFGVRYYGSKKTFSLRNDNEISPGVLEVGTRRHSILVDGVSNIVIEDIDSWGPGGRLVDGDLGGLNDSSFSIQGAATDILVRNLKVTHSNGVGIGSQPDTANIHYDNIAAYENGSTGIYIRGQVGSILNSTSHNNGNLTTDAPHDRGGIGCYLCANVEISGNNVYSNGTMDDDSDHEVSVVSATGPLTISSNYIHDCIQGCIQIAASAPGTRIFHNVISGFGSTTSNLNHSDGKWGGIRVGHITGSQNVKIYNNVITGGQQPATTNDAAITIYYGNNSGAEVRNNIIYGNISRSIYVRFDKGIPGDSGYTDNNNLIFSNNLYDENVGDAKWLWKGQSFEFLSNWQAAGMADANNELGTDSLVGDPLFVDASNDNFHIVASSAANNAGIDVGLTEDYDGVLIINDGANKPEIGAYEFVELTTIITTASYKGNTLTVRAVSQLPNTATLTLDGFGDMEWETKKGNEYWEIKARGVDNPGYVTVTSSEGTTQPFAVQ